MSKDFSDNPPATNPHYSHNNTLPSYSQATGYEIEGKHHQQPQTYPQSQPVGGFAQPSQPQPARVYTQQGPPAGTHVLTVPPSPAFGKTSMQIRCHNCNETVWTKIDTTSATLGAWGVGLALFLSGLCCCCMIPCFMDDFKKVEHTCPKCNCLLGIYAGKYSLAKRNVMRPDGTIAEVRYH